MSHFQREAERQEEAKQEIDHLRKLYQDQEVRIKALQEALRSVLVAYSDIPLPIELRGRLRAILEDSEK